MQMNGLINPEPTAPFLGYSVTETVKTVRDFKSPHYFDGSYRHRCTPALFTEPIINDFKSGIEGFRLDDF